MATKTKTEAVAIFLRMKDGKLYSLPRQSERMVLPQLYLQILKERMVIFKRPPRGSNMEGIHRFRLEKRKGDIVVYGEISTC